MAVVGGEKSGPETDRALAIAEGAHNQQCTCGVPFQSATKFERRDIRSGTLFALSLENRLLTRISTRHDTWPLHRPQFSRHNIPIDVYSTYLSTKNLISSHP